MKGFLKQLLGPSAEAIGEGLAVRHRARLFNNLVEVLAQAKKKLESAGVSPREVPLKIIHPLLEAASLEEEPNLQEVWANLLSNAADPQYSNLVSISFPAILREFGTREVRFLHAVYENTLGIVEFQTKQKVNINVQDIKYKEDELRDLYVKAKLSRSKTLRDLPLEYYAENKKEVDADMSEFALTLSVVKRHEILEEIVDIPPSRLPSGGYQKIDIELVRLYVISQLGTAFIAACRRQ